MTADVLEELASLPTLAHPTASPDGSEVAYYHDVTGRNELHVLDVETGERTQWSDGEVPRNARWFVDWDADGERVFFHLDDDGDEQNDIYAIDRDGTVEPVVEIGGQAVFQDVNDDGERLLFGSTRDGQMNLYEHRFDTGEVTKVTDYDRAVWTAELSPDCDRIAYMTNDSDDYDNADVFVADADGGNARNLGVGEIAVDVGGVVVNPLLAAVRAVVDDDDVVVGDEFVDQMRADEARAAGDDDPLSFEMHTTTRPGRSNSVPIPG